MGEGSRVFISTALCLPKPELQGNIFVWSGCQPIDKKGASDSVWEGGGGVRYQTPRVFKTLGVLIICYLFIDNNPARRGFSRVLMWFFTLQDRKLFFILHKIISLK